MMEIEQTKLNMGCGFRKLEDHWNVDISPKCNPDQVLDFDVTPWPYEDSFFENITASNILEHLGQNPRVFTEIIKEMYRVSKDGATWFIQIPHHRCDVFFDDYTHVRALTEKTFKMWDQKVNYESILKNSADSTYGLYNDVDLEVVDVDYNIIHVWRNELEAGLIGAAQLNKKLNTLANVVDTVSISIKIHKPGRYADFIKK
jgi:predicted SAM-dependent methyltransferase